MKTISFSLLIVLFSIHTFGQQQSVFNEIPPFPTTKDPDVVRNFIQQLDDTKSVFKEKYDRMTNENNAAASNIKPSMDPASYQSATSINDIMALQKANEDMMAHQQMFQDAQQNYEAKRDSIEKAYLKDMEAFRKALNEYNARCIGEGKDQSCAQLRKSVNEKSDLILNKYYFGPNAKYIGLINYWKKVMPELYKLTVTDGFVATEKSLGFTYPHKEDLAMYSMAMDCVDVIKNAFSIEPVLWPL